MRILCTDVKAEMEYIYWKFPLEPLKASNAWAGAMHSQQHPTIYELVQCTDGGMEG